MKVEPEEQAASQPPSEGQEGAAQPSERRYRWGEVEVQQGERPGNRYIKQMRLRPRDSAAVPNSEVLEAGADRPHGVIGNLFRFLIGTPLRSSAETQERLGKGKALALLGTDAIASIAYATEQIVRALAVAGVAAIAGASAWIAVVITALIFIVSFSYRQTIFAYPKGGGSYTVSRENLGTNLGLVAGAALTIDYILNAAVSISAGVAAIVSAFPSLAQHKVLMAIAFLLIITVVNLRGLRESGALFAAPTYAFILSIFGIIIVGAFQVFTGSNFYTEPPSGYSISQLAPTLTLFIVLQAFSAGCTAMTGVEAISNGVPIFKKPEVRNAATTMNWMAGLLAFMFMGVTFLAQQYQVRGVNNNQQTVIDQIARHAYGTGPFYSFFVISTTALLVLAAQTSFSGFPRVAYILARDGFLPKQFSFRGDRLAFNSGILALAIVTAILLFVFGAETDALIPLFAIGAFLSFTLSQSGMVVKWLRERQGNWRRGAFINGLGAVSTGLALVVIAITKFNSDEASVLLSIGNFKVHAGAWIVILLLPLLVAMFRSIKSHYLHVARELRTNHIDMSDPALQAERLKHFAIVPISAVNQISARTLAYARSFADRVTAVHVTDELEEADELKAAWNKYYAASSIHLVILESPYRTLVRPLISYLEDVHCKYPDHVLTVLLPDFVARHWWENILHTQVALRLKAALLFHPDIIVTSVPYHFGEGGQQSLKQDVNPCPPPPQ